MGLAVRLITSAVKPLTRSGIPHHCKRLRHDRTAKTVVNPKNINGSTKLQFNAILMMRSEFKEFTKPEDKGIWSGKPCIAASIINPIGTDKTSRNGAGGLHRIVPL